MIKINKTTEYLEKIFWIFLFINPFLDIFNGAYIQLIRHIHVLDVEYISTLGVTPSLLIRMVMLVVFALYVLLVKDTKSILTALPIGAAWLLSMVSEYLSTGSAKLFLDTQYTARFCYNIVILMVYTQVFAKRWGEGKEAILKKLNNVICFTLLLLSLSIIIPSIMGWGYSTYADRLGYRGSRGFFYAGNDITAILALLLPICLALCINCNIRENPKAFIFPALAAAFGINTMLIIGSKTAFLACYITAALLGLAAIISAVREKKIRPIVNIVIVLLLAGLIILTLNFISRSYTAPDGTQSGSMMDVIMESMDSNALLNENEGAASAMLHGRDDKFAFHFSQFKEGGILVWLFGLGRGSQATILEMDVFEVVFYYGIFGFCAMMWLYGKVAIEFFLGFFRKKDLMGIALFASLGICAGYLFIAGHVLFSVTSGFYLALVIVYSRLYFADESHKLLLWKPKKEKISA